MKKSKRVETILGILVFFLAITGSFLFLFLPVVGYNGDPVFSLLGSQLVFGTQNALFPDSILNYPAFNSIAFLGFFIPVLCAFLSVIWKNKIVYFIATGLLVISGILMITITRYIKIQGSLGTHYYLYNAFGKGYKIQIGLIISSTLVLVSSILSLFHGIFKNVIFKDSKITSNEYNYS